VDLLSALRSLWHENLGDDPEWHLSEVIRTGQIHVFYDREGIAGWVDWWWLTEDAIRPFFSGGKRSLDPTVGLHLCGNTGRFVRPVSPKALRRVCWRVIRSRPTRTVCWQTVHKQDRAILHWRVINHG